VFRSLPVAHERHAADSLPVRARAYARDTVTLGWEERLKTRGRRRSDRGIEFGTALPRGTVLRAGDCLILDHPALVVCVIEREEPVLIVRPAGAPDWALVAYHIGNSHQPLMIAADGLVCPDGPGMEQVLAYHRIPFTRELRAFTPVGDVARHQHAQAVSTL